MPFDDFDWDDEETDRFGDDETEQPDPVREALERPLRQKARAIARLATALVAGVGTGPAHEPDTAPLLEYTKDCLLENACLLGAKLANACAGTDYGHRLEMAVLIKRAAVELLTQTTSLRAYAAVPDEYLDALRAEVDEFRLLFKPWVAAFDRTDFYDDGWGLFDRLLP